MLVINTDLVATVGRGSILEIETSLAETKAQPS